MPEIFGLGAYLVTQGRSVLEAGLIVPDDLDSESRSVVTCWARDHPVDTTGGPKPWAVVTVSEFFDPRVGTFVKRAYSGAGWCIGADLGRVFGLIAEHIVPRLRKNAGSWDLWLPEWGVVGDRQNVRRASPHRPCLRVSARRVGWQIDFGPCEKGFGKYVGKRQWTGAFFDVLSLAYALDADRGADFAEHREDFGLSPIDMPIAVTLDADGAAEVAKAVTAVHELAVVLDERSAEWFTTSRDRAEGRGRLNLARTVSSGGIAAQIVTRAGVRAPMLTFGLDEDEHRKWAESCHGGWIEADPRLLGVPFSAVTADVSSCFPLDAHLIGWWDLFCADRIERRNVTAELHRLCERVAEDPNAALDPKVWRRFGCCLVEVVPHGEVFPIEVEDDRRPDGRLEFVPVFSPDRSMYFSALDVLAATINSAKVPKIIEATAYVPVGRQSGLRRHLPILPGLVIDVDRDPIPQLVALRRKAKAAGDVVLAALLRVIVNALVFGNGSRFDEVLTKDGDSWVRSERPGPLNCLPIASSVTAGSHLLLSVLDRTVRDRGGIVAYRNTDSSIIPASPDGGDRELSWDEVDQVLGVFDPLSPDPGWSVWKSEWGTSESPLQAFVYGVNRHAEMVGDEIVEVTETGLGGTYVDPPALHGRAPNGYRHWSSAAVEREVAYTIARQRDPDNALRPDACWDVGVALPFPALRRFMVKTPEMAKQLPASLGARPGTRYLQASGWSWSVRWNGQTVVALDPGGDLSRWQRLDWFNTRTGDPEWVSTDPTARDAFVLEPLAERGIEWSRPPKSEPIESVVVDSDLIAHVGRVSGVIDAAGDGLGDLRSHRPVHEDADRAAFVHEHARKLRKRAFADRTGLPPTVAERAALGEPISPRNVDIALRALLAGHDGRTCALDGCDEPVTRAGAKFCSPRCRRIAGRRTYRLRRKAKVAERWAPVRSRKPRGQVAALHTDSNVDAVLCQCGAALSGGAVERGTCWTCNKAEAVA
jgi:hypothetical protein